MERARSMSDDSKGSEPPRWVISQSQKIVAGRTLVALKAALSEPGGVGVAHAHEVKVPLAEVPELHSVGGIARVAGPGTPVAIARVGRVSYVAYRLSRDALEELEVELDPAGTILTIRATLAV